MSTRLARSMHDHAPRAERRDLMHARADIVADVLAVVIVIGLVVGLWWLL